MAYPTYDLNVNYRNLYRNPVNLTDPLIEEQLATHPVWAPFGTGMGRNPDEYVDDLSRIGQKEGPLLGYYPENATQPLIRQLEGPPNVGHVWPNFADIGTGYLTPAPIHPNYKLVFDDWGKVKFVNRLGSGSYGQVWKVHVTKAGKQYALEYACKVIDLKHSQYLSNSLRDLLADSRNLVGLDHPNVCTILDTLPVADPQSHFPFSRLLLLMECCPDVLNKQLQQNPCGLPETDCLSLLIGAVKGLKYLHDNRVAHLDIKPPNILIGKNRETKLTDFGLSLRFPTHCPMVVPARQLWGTPGYISPEMLNNFQGIDALPCDIYSMGRTIVHTLIGNRNFQALTNHTNMMAYLQPFASRTPPNIHLPNQVGGISQPFAKLIISMLDVPRGRPDIDTVAANTLWPGYIPKPSFWTRTKQFFTNKP